MLKGPTMGVYRLYHPMSHVFHSTYLSNINGFIMSSPITEELVNVVQKVIAMDGSTLANMARNAYTIGEQFPSDHYNKRTQNDILNQEDQGSDA